MVPSAGNGVGGMESGGMMQNNGSNQPPATEYTLQGVMRFLQSEWHRHERDRNSWEIEKQEMKGRIANLEGQARRADATQKALRKYVSILERKVKDQATQLKALLLLRQPRRRGVIVRQRYKRSFNVSRCISPDKCSSRHLTTQYVLQPRRRPNLFPGQTTSRLRNPMTRRIDKSSRASLISVSLNSCTS